MTYLDEILASHRQQAAADTRDFQSLFDTALEAPATRGFANAIQNTPPDEIAVIAEIKRRSPSKGNLREGLNPDFVDPAQLAQEYQTGGASCLSVLTDNQYFNGSPEDLAAARNSTQLPVLRKDFTVDAKDVLDARIMGADCVLLIAAALTQDELIRFSQLATQVGMDSLVEIHDEAELEAALTAEASLVGVNQRDLLTFEVDQSRAVHMASNIPDSVIKVAESGIQDATDAQALAEAGYDAVLVGETLVRSVDPAQAVRCLRSPA